MTYKLHVSTLQKQFIRFCIVGALCTFIDAGVFYIIHESVGYRFAIVLGFSVSIFINYLLNISWSFNRKPSLKNAVGMFFAHLFNIFIVRMSLMWFFVDFLEMNEGFAYLPTLFISILTNFLIVRCVIKL